MILGALTTALAFACAWLLWREFRHRRALPSNYGLSGPEGLQLGELLRASIELLSEGFALYDSEDRLILCNERFRQLHGLNREAMKPGTRYEDILRDGLARKAYPQAAGREQEWLADRLRQYREGADPVELQLADGRWMLVFEQRTVGDHTVGIFADITDLKQREADLILAERGLSEVLESMEEGFALLDERDRLILWNQKYVEMFPLIGDLITYGATVEELMRAAAERGQVKGSQEDKEAWVQERLKAYRELDSGSELHFKDGRWALTRKYRGMYGRTLAIFLDISEIKQREEQLREAKLQAEAANRIKSEFLANMSHELRTPLNAIIGFSDILIAEKAGPIGVPAYRDYAQDINEGGRRLLTIIEDIIDLSRLETGKVELREAEIGLANLLDLCRRAYEDKAVGAGVSFDTVAPEPDVEIWGDQVRLRQILHNLISNAIKFTPRGGSVRLEGTHHANGDVLLKVGDSGIGMTPTEAQFALEPFRQAEPSLARSHDGSGIGLTLCQSLVQLHGGKVEIESEKGKGTTVTVRLPASRVVAAETPTQAAGD